MGLLEPFTHLDAQFAKGKTLDPLTQAKPLKTHPNLRQDLDRLTHAGYLLSLWNACLPEREPSEELFRLLQQGLNAMQHLHPGLLTRWLELRLLDHLGYAPDFTPCHPRARWFSPSQGRTTCEDCGPPASDARVISQKAVKSFYHLNRMTLEDLTNRHPDDQLAQELEDILKSHFEAHLRIPKMLHL